LGRKRRAVSGECAWKKIALGVTLREVKVCSTLDLKARQEFEAFTVEVPSCFRKGVAMCVSSLSGEIVEEGLGTEILFKVEVGIRLVVIDLRYRKTLRLKVVSKRYKGIVFAAVRVNHTDIALGLEFEPKDAPFRGVLY
jgi:hypothetical protein